MHFHVKLQENGSKNIFRGKQTNNKVPLMFFNFKVLIERNNCVSGLSEEKSKVYYLYLESENVKVSCKERQLRSER